MSNWIPINPNSTPLPQFKIKMTHKLPKIVKVRDIAFPTYLFNTYFHCKIFPPGSGSPPRESQKVSDILKDLFTIPVSIPVSEW